MSKLAWDVSGERTYEYGVDRGALYIPVNGVYTTGYVWNGLTTVTESPTGAEATPQYADNMKYLNLVSVEEFGATIEAFTYPRAFGQCDGTAEASPGVLIGLQGRKQFGFSYRTRIGNDQNPDAGYKIHLVYGALAAPSEQANPTVNDTPEAKGFSWEVTTTPVAVTAINPATGQPFKPTAHIVIDSTQVLAANLTALEDILYGVNAGPDARLPLPDEVIALFAGGIVAATPVMPTFTPGTGALVIPSTTGVDYRNQATNAIITGTITVPAASTYGVKATPKTGYKLATNADDDWSFTRP